MNSDVVLLQEKKTGLYSISEPLKFKNQAISSSAETKMVEDWWSFLSWAVSLPNLAWKSSPENGKSNLIKSLAGLTGIGSNSSQILSTRFSLMATNSTLALLPDSSIFLLMVAWKDWTAL
ncbi:hypothetical protein WICPIJ_002452 [Wickerhamomyces pijperi]|uniref:Uncharacterized protein n=1 Tax=Wickerhamomyces pijperi TaxID=599730 RepID=A0A9P8TQ60_WICPI|nr:hypothetical protein WICPIJ_002452 [Wickerhamomyces pijperi]